jgi:hypothetical protein
MDDTRAKLASLVAAELTCRESWVLTYAVVLLLRRGFDVWNDTYVIQLEISFVASISDLNSKQIATAPHYQS